MLFWTSTVLILYLSSRAVYESYFFSLYFIFIIYYIRLYWKLLFIPFWAYNTMDLLKGNNNVDYKEKLKNTPLSDLPEFIVLIAAYKAEGSIGLVLDALKNQQYPKDKYNVIVITQASEYSDKKKYIDETGEKIRKLLIEKARVKCNEFEIKIISKVIRKILNQSPELTIKEIDALIITDLFLKKNKWKISGEILDAIVGTDFTKSNSLDPLLSLLNIKNNKVRYLLRKETRIHSESSNRILNSYAQILDFNDQEQNPPESAKSIALQLSKESIRSRLLLLLLRIIAFNSFNKYINQQRKVFSIYEKKINEFTGIQSSIEDLLSQMKRNCPETVNDKIKKINQDHFYHICRTKVGGGKPESLNTAYFELVSNGIIPVTKNTYVIVIDADSLMHSKCLVTIANEIIQDNEKSSLRQLVPLSTSNFYGNNVFAKLVSCLDTIGSTGKWAFNTRTLKKPDLPAGSGIVIPFIFLEYLEMRKGRPWSGDSITEDARMIISDYGLLNGANSKTKFVPGFLLEAVPETKGVFSNYFKYWTQRMRWSSGGPNELVELIKSFGNDYYYFDQKNENYQKVRESVPLKIISKIRHFRLIMQWCSDHLWWGLGYSMALPIWLIFSFNFYMPFVLNILGTLLFLGTPMVVIYLFYRKAVEFIPGGLSFKLTIKMYFSAFFFCWAMGLPIIYTQFLYLFTGDRFFRDWKTTEKPSFL